MKYPSDDWIKIIFLGFIILISFTGILTEFNPIVFLFIIVGFLPLGYLFRVLKKTFEGSNELPDFDKIVEMYIDGLKVGVVIIVYALPLIIISLISLYNQPITISMLTVSGFTIWGFLAGSSIQILVFIFIGLIEFIAIANMALYEGELSAAFRFGEILKRISHIGWKKYLTAYILIWTIGLIAVVISIFTFILLIGIVLVPLLIVPYFALISTRIVALTFASSES